jgi:hypothetical protein
MKVSACVKNAALTFLFFAKTTKEYNKLALFKILTSNALIRLAADVSVQVVRSDPSILTKQKGGSGGERSSK